MLCTELQTIVTTGVVWIKCWHRAYRRLSDRIVCALSIDYIRVYRS